MACPAVNMDDSDDEDELGEVMDGIPHVDLPHQTTITTHHDQPHLQPRSTTKTERLKLLKELVHLSECPQSVTNTPLR